jgi:protein-disulfide isomerase
MHHALFENRDRLGDETYRRLARQIDLDPDLLAATMESDAVRRIVAGDIALANELGIAGTPAMFLDGRLVNELCESAVFWRAYAAAGRPAAQTELARD